LKKSGEKIIVM